MRIEVVLEIEADSRGESFRTIYTPEILHALEVALENLLTEENFYNVDHPLDRDIRFECRAIHVNPQAIVKPKRKKKS